MAHLNNINFSDDENYRSLHSKFVLHIDNEGYFLSLVGSTSCGRSYSDFPFVEITKDAYEGFSHYTMPFEVLLSLFSYLCVLEGKFLAGLKNVEDRYFTENTFLSHFDVLDFI